jgi:hypothetical protein
MTYLNDLKQAQQSEAMPMTYPSEGAFLTAGLTQSDLDTGKGFVSMTESAPSMDFFESPRETSSGDTFVGDPYTRGGFLGRPNGWER